MNKTMEIILNRRSIRRFEDKEISEGILHDILEAARWAPSWGNSQCWEIIIVKNKDQKKELASTLSKKNPATLTVQHAPVVLAMCAELKKSGFYKGTAVTKLGDWFMYDLGIATQNITLAAHALGLGSVIVGAFDHDKAKGLLNLPKGFEVASLVPIGYPAHSPPPPTRKKIEDFCHPEKFSKK